MTPSRFVTVPGWRPTRRWPALLGALVATLALAACGSSPSGTAHPPTGGAAATSTTVAPTSTTAAPTSTTAAPTSTAGASPTGAPPHVMVIMMENKSYDEVVGQASQPYTNGLADDYGSATRSYAFGHPSLPNYLDLVSGSNQGVSDDGPPASHSFPGAPTLANQLAADGISEKAYAEDLPADPAEDAGRYAVRHFPWVYFPGTPMPIADAGSLLGDLRSPSPPDFVWYTPNVIDDEHDGTVQQGDAFLSRLIPEVQATPWYRAGGQIVVEWDEAEGDSSGINGTTGGRVPTIVVSAALKASPRQDATPVDTTGILASIENCYGVGHLAGAADPANGNIDALLLSCRPRRG